MKIDDKYNNIHVHEDYKLNNVQVNGRFLADMSSLYGNIMDGTFITKNSPDRYIMDGYKITLSEDVCQLERIENGRVRTISNMPFDKTKHTRLFNINHHKHIVDTNDESEQDYHYWYETSGDLCNIHRFPKRVMDKVERFPTFFRTTTPTIIMESFQTDSSVPDP